MAQSQPVLDWRTAWGEPVTSGDVAVTPQSQALVVRWPGGGWVWNRPIGVAVERGGGREYVPIVDVSRWAVWGLLALSAAFFAAGMATGGRPRRQRNGRRG